MSEPNEFDAHRRQRERGERRGRFLVRVLDILTALALLAIAVIVLKNILK